MSLTRTYFGELQASTEQNINQLIRQEVDVFFYIFREKAEQLRNMLIRSSEDRKRDQQTQERLTRQFQALNEGIPELIIDSKVLREELETMLQLHHLFNKLLITGYIEYSPVLLKDL